MLMLWGFNCVYVAGPLWVTAHRVSGDGDGKTFTKCFGLVSCSFTDGVQTAEGKYE